jgi:hypothetical protein
MQGAVVATSIVPMPYDGAIIFDDLIGKLDALEVACDKCGRKGRYAVARLIAVNALISASIAIDEG